MLLDMLGLNAHHSAITMVLKYHLKLAGRLRMAG